MNREKQILSKLVALNKQIEGLLYYLEDLEFQKEKLAEVHDLEMKALAIELDSKSRGECVLVDKNFRELYSKSYSGRIGELKGQLEARFTSKKAQLESEAKKVTEALADIAATANQVGHNIETALNALNVQVGMTKREIARDIKVAKDKGVRQKREQELLESARIKDLEEKHEQKKMQIETSASKERIRVSRKAGDQKPKRIDWNRVRSDLRSLKHEAAELGIEMNGLGETVANIEKKGRERIESLKSRTLAVCQEVCEIVGDAKTKEVGNTRVYKRLDESLKQQVAEIRTENTQRVKETLAKIENLKLIMDMDIRDNYRAIDERGKAVLRAVQAHTAELNELLKQQTEELEDARAAKSEAQSRRNEEISILESQLKDKEAELSSEFKKLREAELARQSSEFQSDIARLMAGFSNDQVSAEQHLDKMIQDEQQKHDREMASIERQRHAADQERVKLIETLEVLKDWMPEEEDIGELDQSDILQLQERQDREFAEALKRNQSVIAEFKKDQSRLVQEKANLLQKRHAAEIQDIDRLFTEKSEQYRAIDAEYAMMYKKRERKLADLTGIRAGDNEFLSKSGRIIESLKHQSYQLQSTMKFQRAALESEWKMAMQDENTRYDNEKAKFSDTFKKLEHLNRLQQELDNKRSESENETAALERQLDQAILESGAIRREIEFTQSSCDQEIEKWTRHLEETKNECREKISSEELIRDSKIAEAQALLDECHHKVRLAVTSVRRDTKSLALELEGESRELRQKCSDLVQAIEAEIAQDEDTTKKSIRMGAYDFELAEREIVRCIDTLEKEKNETEICHTQRCNEQMSSYEMAIEELSKSNMEELKQIVDKRKAIVGFFEERIEVLSNKRGEIEALARGTGPRAAEKEKILALQQRVKKANGDLDMLKKKLAAVKMEMAKRDRGYDHNFGKRPHVGTLGRNGSTLPVRHSL